MSGNKERPRQNSTLDMMFEDARLLAYWLERKGLVDSVRSIDALATMACIIGISGTDRYLKLVARTTREIFNTR